MDDISGRESPVAQPGAAAMVSASPAGFFSCVLPRHAKLIVSLQSVKVPLQASVMDAVTALVVTFMSVLMLTMASATSAHVYAAARQSGGAEAAGGQGGGGFCVGGGVLLVSAMRVPRWPIYTTHGNCGARPRRGAAAAHARMAASQASLESPARLDRCCGGRISADDTISTC